MLSRNIRINFSRHPMLDTGSRFFLKRGEVAGPRIKCGVTERTDVSSFGLTSELAQ
jgi:hypothetical protein